MNEIKTGLSLPPPPPPAHPHSPAHTLTNGVRVVFFVVVEGTPGSSDIHRCTLYTPRVQLYSVQLTYADVFCTTDMCRRTLYAGRISLYAVHRTLDVCRCTLYTGRILLYMPLYSVDWTYAVVRCTLHVCCCTLCTARMPVYAGRMPL